MQRLNLRNSIQGALATSLILGSSSLSAMTPFIQQSTNLTLGQSSQSNTLFGSVNNPAAAAAMSGTKWKFGVLNAGFRTELGPVNNMIDDVDTLNDNMDFIQEKIDSSTLTYAFLYKDSTGATCKDILCDVQGVINSGNELLQTVGKSGYADFGLGVSIPMMPMIISAEWLKGSLTIDAHAYAQGKLQFLDAPFIQNPLSKEIETNSAVYIKGAQGAELGIGYSRQIFQHSKGNLYAGGRGKLIQMSLTKVLVGFDDSDDLEQVFEDSFDDNMESATDFGLDAGLIWVAEHYSLGLTANNLLEPEFNYGDVTENCASNTTASCLLAIAHAGRLDTQESHVMNTQVIMDGAIYSANKNWSLSFSYDLNSILDPVGNEYQYMAVGMGYLPNTWYKPGVRVGYRANQTGSELSELTLGFTWLRANLDIAWGQESIEVDGDALPRTVAINLGIDLAF